MGSKWDTLNGTFLCKMILFEIFNAKCIFHVGTKSTKLNRLLTIKRLYMKCVMGAYISFKRFI